MNVKVKLRNGKFINTDEEGAEAVAEDTAATEESSKSMESTMGELESKSGELASLQAEVDELKGELSVYKEKLDELLSEEAVESAALEMIEEQGEAEEIIENALIKNSEGEEVAADEKDKIKNSIRKLRGTKLHQEVLTLVGMNVENMSAEAAKGAFKAHAQICNTHKAAKVVVGAKVMNSTIPAATEVKVAAAPSRDSRQKLGLK